MEKRGKKGIVLMITTLILQGEDLISVADHKNDIQCDYAASLV